MIRGDGASKGRGGEDSPVGFRMIATPLRPHVLAFYSFVFGAVLIGCRRPGALSPRRRRVTLARAACSPIGSGIGAALDLPTACKLQTATDWEEGNRASTNSPAVLAVSCRDLFRWCHFALTANGAVAPPEGG
jgi:hypothetical protein